MFISIEQPRIILACLFIGVILGVYYELFFFLSLFFKKRIIKEIIKCFGVFSFAPIFTAFSLAFEFPNFRLYMAVCIALGAIMYKFSFHKAVAIFLLRVYNVIKITFSKIKLRLKKANERRKEKASVLRGIKRTNNAGHRARGGNNVSAHRYNFSQKSNRKVRCGNCKP